VIARAWSARATLAGATAYELHFRAGVLPALARVAGHRGAQLLRCDDGDRVELLVLTYWDSIEAITRFAGVDPEAAVVEDDARAALISYDARVKHLQVVADTTH
jgi:heme-degrading monooxygenase HmoA